MIHAPYLGGPYDGHAASHQIRPPQNTLRRFHAPRHGSDVAHVYRFLWPRGWVYLGVFRDGVVIVEDK